MSVDLANLCKKIHVKPYNCISFPFAVVANCSGLATADLLFVSPVLRENGLVALASLFCSSYVVCTCVSSKLIAPHREILTNFSLSYSDTSGNYLIDLTG